MQVVASSHVRQTDTRSLLNCENPSGRPFSAFRMLRSVNAPPVALGIVRKTDDFLSFLFSYLLSVYDRFFLYISTSESHRLLVSVFTDIGEN